MYDADEDDVDQSFPTELDTNVEQSVSSAPSRSLGTAPRPLPHVSPQIAHKRGRNHTVAHPFYPLLDRHNWYEHTDAQILSLMDSEQVAGYV